MLNISEWAMSKAKETNKVNVFKLNHQIISATLPVKSVSQTPLLQELGLSIHDVVPSMSKPRK